MGAPNHAVHPSNNTLRLDAPLNEAAPGTVYYVYLTAPGNSGSKWCAPSPPPPHAEPLTPSHVRALGEVRDQGRGRGTDRAPLPSRADPKRLVGRPARELGGGAVGDAVVRRHGCGCRVTRARRRRLCRDSLCLTGIAGGPRGEPVRRTRRQLGIPAPDHRRRSTELPAQYPGVFGFVSYSIVCARQYSTTRPSMSLRR